MITIPICKKFGSFLLPCVFAGLLLPIPIAAKAANLEQFSDPLLRQELAAAINNSPSVLDPIAAEIWLRDMSHRLKPWINDESVRLALLRAVYEEADYAGLQPNLVLAVIEVESGFRQNAVSSAGARGLMQIMPFWLQELSQPEADLFDLRTNLRFGCTILRYYIERERKYQSAKGLNRGLARYNGSLGRDFYWLRVRKALNEHWFIQ